MSYWPVPGAVVALVAAETGQALGVSLGHFIAAGLTVLGIVLVAKGYDWVENKIDRKIREAFDTHNALDEARAEAIRKEVQNLRDLIERLHAVR